MRCGWHARQRLKQKVPFTEAEWAENHTWIQDQLKHEMYVTAFSYEAAQKVQAQNDPEIAKALTFMPEAVALLDRSNKLIVQRTGHF